MSIRNLDGIDLTAFADGATAKDLYDDRCRDVPPRCGVYLVIRDAAEAPVFLPTSGAGHFKNRDPSFPAIEVNARWVPGARIVYIGKAGEP